MASKNISKQETGLQAVVISDNFNSFALALETSWALLPLAGARIIDYTIEFLLETSVDEIIIFSVFQSKQVEQYIRERWINSGLISFRVTFLSSQSCHSLGDVLREIDSKALIKSDFLLTQAGFVSNFDLTTALATYRARRVKDKNAVLTLIYSECSINHSSRCRESDTFLVLDTITNRLLHSQHFTNTTREFEYPLDVLTMNDDVTSRFDLLDCNMAICSAQIPPLFSDNFDFQTRRHLIREILTNEEILAYRMFMHIVQDKYAVFIGDMNTYISINQNILERWCFPIVPDALNGNENTLARYSWRWPNIYVAEEVKRIAKNARIDRSVLIGANCEISENCQLINVVMGENCIIGPNSVLKNCVLWKNVIIESDCIVEQSILCDKSRLGSKSSLKGRCIIGHEVNIPSGMEVACGNVLRKNRTSEDSEIISESSGFAPDVFRWRMEETSTNDEQAEIWSPYVYLELIDRSDSVSTDGSIESDGSDDDKSNAKPSDPDPIIQDDDQEDEHEIFSQEVLESLKRGYAEKIDCANLIMEINSSKHAYNVPVAELQRRVMTAILTTALEQDRIKIDNATDLVKAYKSVLAQFTLLINNYFKPKNHTSVANEEMQLRCLDTIKDFALTKQSFIPALSQVFFFLYDKEIFEEEIFLKWSTRLQEPLKGQLQSFIQWLKEAEEESSDSD